MMSAKTRKLIAILVALLVLALLVWGFWRASQPAPEVFQGQMEARETDVAGKVTARVAEVAVKEGDRIQAGAVLVRMDSPEVRAKLAQATAAEQAAQAVAEKAQNGARPQEVEMARMQWQRAETAAQLAQTSFRRVDGLAREGLVADQKRDEAEANWKASRDAAIAAKAQYDMARTGARPEDKAAASAQARQVAGVVAEAKAAKAETELRSPVGGEVAKVLAKVGELSPQGVAVVTVVDLNDQWVCARQRVRRPTARAARRQAHRPLQGLLQRRAARLRDLARHPRRRGLRRAHLRGPRAPAQAHRRRAARHERAGRLSSR